MAMHSIIYYSFVALSLALLVIASISSWISIPGYLNAGFELEMLMRLTTAGTALFLTVVFFAKSKPEKWKGYIARFAPVILVGYLSFPLLFQFYYPQASTHAAWLQAQHQNLSWLGGDIYTTQEYASFDKKNRLFVVDSPREVSAVVAPNLKPELFSLGTIQDLINWLGYGTHFLQFASKGFFASLCSLIILSSLAFRTRGHFEFSLFSIWLKRILTNLAGVILLTSGLALLSGHYIRKAEQATMFGYYDKARGSLLTSAKFMPSLRQSSSWILQLGLLEYKLNIKSVHKDIFLAKANLDTNKKHRAVSFAQDHASSTELAGVNREARRILLRSAIDSYNSGKISESYSKTKLILQTDPNSLKANFLAQLIALQKKDYANLRNLVARQKETYNYFNMENERQMRPGLPWIIITLVSVLTTVFLAQILYPAYPVLKPMNQSTSWIKSENSWFHSYFRKTVFINKDPQRAWLAVSAKDGFELLVNGNTAGRFFYWRPTRPFQNGLSAIGQKLTHSTPALSLNYPREYQWTGHKSYLHPIYFDLGPHLKKGKNIVAIKVESRGNKTSLFAAGEILLSTGETIALSSDSSWKSSSLPKKEKNLHWSDANYSDDEWSNAREFVGKEKLLSQFSSDIFKLPFEGKKLTSPSEKSTDGLWFETEWQTNSYSRKKPGSESTQTVFTQLRLTANHLEFLRVSLEGRIKESGS